MLKAMVYAAVLSVVAIFLWLLADVLWHGLAHVSWEFVSEMPRSAGRKGGILSILVSTAMVLAVTLVVAVPFALATAIWLSEFTRQGSRVAHFVRVCLDVLAGMPSIVFGLFGNAFFCGVLGLGFSILSGGLTLACMVLPILIRALEAGLSSLPHAWRQGAAALGMRHSAAIVHILLPAAAPALGAGLMLGVGRAMAETAALLFTSGYVDRMPSGWLDSGRVLAVHIYDLAMNVAGGDKAAYASALVLMGSLMVINGLALWGSKALLARKVSL